MMKLKEGIDYHIREVGKSFELSSVSLAGYTAGVIELTRRSFEINQSTITNKGMLLMVKTVPKVKKVAKAKAVKKTAPAKVVAPKVAEPKVVEEK